MFVKQAGAEQAVPSSGELKLGPITQVAVAGARSLAERQIKLYLHKGMVR